MADARKSARRIVSALIVAIGGVLAAFVLGEIALRLSGFVEPHLITYDSHRGWALLPNARGVSRDEGSALVQINRYGFRGPERPPQKAAHEFRIVVLGDSFTEAQQVPYRDTFCAVIERRLRAACPALRGWNPEVLDFGVDSYGTAQEMLTLRDQALAFHPDVVVTAVFIGNDLRNNSAQLENEPCRPYFTLVGRQLVPVGPFAASWTRRLRCRARFFSRYSQVLDLLGMAKGRMRAELGKIWARSKPAAHDKREPVHSARPRARYAAGGAEEPTLGEAIYTRPTSQAWNQAWQITEAELKEIARLARTHGAWPLVVTLSTPVQVYPDPQWRQAYAARLGVDDLFYPERRIAAAGARDGYAVLNLAPALAEWADEHHEFVHGFSRQHPGWGHWNQLGHRLAGRLIAQKICAEAHPGTQSPSAHPN